MRAVFMARFDGGVRLDMEMTYRLWICLLAWLAITTAEQEGGRREEMVFPEKSSSEGVLISNLLTGYERRGGRYGRPVYNHTHAVPVRLGLQLIQIIDLDEKNQVLKLNLWTHYEWVDEFLRWDPEDYEDVKVIRIPSKVIWTPDIKLYNYADTRREERREAMCVVYHDGNVTWIPQGIYMSTCDVDVTTFPFDKQTCHLKFGSWAYDGTKLNLSFKDNDPQMKKDDYFVENKAWSVLNLPASQNNISYQCCPDEFYLDLTYTVVFRRSATFYTYILILPCVLLTSLTLVLYWIPPESPTKMSLGMSIFMAFFVLLLLFEGNMPPASEFVPILGTYYCLNMVLITTSTFLNVFVVNLSFYGSRAPLPKLLKKIMFQFLARAMCMDNLARPFLEADKKRLIHLTIPGIGMANGDSKWPKNWKGSSELLNKTKDEYEADLQLGEIDTKLSDIRELLNKYSERTEEKDRKEKIAKEWKAVGLIFDRMFFWIYLVTILASLTVVLSVIFTGS